MDIHRGVQVLVSGATGFVGRALVPGLLAAGHDVVAATRNPERYDGPGRSVHLDLALPASESGLVWSDS